MLLVALFRSLYYYFFLPVENILYTITSSTRLDPSDYTYIVNYYKLSNLLYSNSKTNSFENDIYLHNC
jgi:hypothetical protein